MSKITSAATSERPKLSELAIKYGSDKYYKHGYIPIYEKLFEGFNPKKILEIGIGYPGRIQRQLPDGVCYVAGAGCRMLADYFPDAQITGIDIREDALINEGRIRSYVADQLSSQDLTIVANISGPFDCIIDDGDHRLSAKHIPIATLWPHLTVDGFYVIEDMLLEDAQTLINQIGFGEIYFCGRCRDDTLLVLRKSNSGTVPFSGGRSEIVVDLS